MSAGRIKQSVFSVRWHVCAIVASVFWPVAATGMQIPAFHNESAETLRAQYGLADSLARSGNARDALDVYANAYLSGRANFANVSAGKRPPEQLEAAFIQVAYRYAWFLLDIGEIGLAEAVEKTLDGIGQTNDISSTPRPLLLPYARFESLKARLSGQRKQSAEAQVHARRASGLMARAVSLDPGDLDYAEAAAVFYGNQALDASPSEKKELSAKVCALADAMAARNPVDRRTIQLRVRCLNAQGDTLVSEGNLPGATQKFVAAREAISSGLRSDQNDGTLLLLITAQEDRLATISLSAGPNSPARQHRLAAKGYFVRATRGKTTMEPATFAVKDAYQTLRDVDFPDTQERRAYFEELAKAIEKNVAAFPKSPSFLYVAADVSAHIAELTEGGEAQRRAAEVEIKKAVDLYDRIGILKDSATFSEDFEAYCRARYTKAKIYAQSGRDSLALDEVKKTGDACEPVLTRYPWDFPLRIVLINARALAGKSLFTMRRYPEAVKALEFASLWGNKDSSTLLARVYREGLGVAKNPQTASTFETLARGQAIKRFTIPAYFGGARADFNLYAVAWPGDYPYNGIDDQVRWLKEARGGVIPPVVVESFHKLDKIARESKVSFPDLCEYALGKKSP